MPRSACILRIARLAFWGRSRRTLGFSGCNIALFAPLPVPKCPIDSLFSWPTFRGSVTLIPTPITAALAGAFAGIVMPILWPRLATDGMILIVVFLFVVALPAHALVIGFGRKQPANPRSVDTALLKRVGAWLAFPVSAAAIGQALRA